MCIKYTLMFCECVALCIIFTLSTDRQATPTITGRGRRVTCVMSCAVIVRLIWLMLLCLNEIKSPQLCYSIRGKLPRRGRAVRENQLHINANAFEMKPSVGTYMGLVYECPHTLATIWLASMQFPDFISLWWCKWYQLR